jgi:hypothetical protein
VAHLNFGDSFAAITNVSTTETTVAFSDTGQALDIHFVSHASRGGLDLLLAE